MTVYTLCVLVPGFVTCEFRGEELTEVVVGRDHQGPTLDHRLESPLVYAWMVFSNLL